MRTLYMITSGSADPTRASVPLHLAVNGSLEVGHTVGVVLAGDATELMHLETLWIKNVTITTGLVDTHSTPTLLRLAGEGRLNPRKFGTHHFKLDEMIDAYSVFAEPARTNALKVVLSAT